MIQNWIHSYFTFHPHLATEKGYGGLDHLLPDYSSLSVRRFLDRAEKIQTDDSLKGRLLRSSVDSACFGFRYLGVLEKNPVFYLKAGLDSLENLQWRNPTPPWEKFQQRLEGLPSLLRVATEQLTRPEHPAVDVAREMATEAIGQLGVTFSPNLAPRAVVEACDGARRALERFADWLERCHGEPFQPMGEEIFRRLLWTEHLLSSTPAQWEQLAQCTLDRLDSEPPPPEWRGEDPGELSRELVFEYYHREMEIVRRFVEESELVTVPPGPVFMVETPEYLEPLVSGAFYLEPALFNGDRTGRFFLPPIPREFGPREQQRYAARLSAGGFRNLVVHEVWPGHHLQFLHAGLEFKPLHNLRDNDVMLEGWALYCEELMEKAGLYGGQSFAPRRRALKFRALRVLADIGLHTGQRDLQQTVDLMTDYIGEGARPWLLSEVRRYALEPTQAMSYFLGFQLINDLREECALPDRSFHDRFLSYGPIPIPLIRWGMTGQKLKATEE